MQLAVAFLFVTRDTVSVDSCGSSCAQENLHKGVPTQACENLTGLLLKLVAATSEVISLDDVEMCFAHRSPKARQVRIAWPSFSFTDKAQLAVLKSAGNEVSD